ncbi:conjugal transfer protein TrbF [Caulobacter soli]|uniref:conjugal transfer protein TrbF n=1 Tax=Caulobacter soli TaxID=2708539 RepID=UPI0013EB13B4|nr:conjugal transfer protein TrbF [Caulobacter soli]
MSLIFKRAQERYGDAAPIETPYQRAAQVWDDRIGAARVQARNWRLMAMLCAGLAALTQGAYIYERQSSRVRTYIVPVDRFGQAGRIELADAAYRPDQADKAAFVKDYVEKVRGKSTDGVVLRDNWERAKRASGKDATVALMQYAQARNPAERLGEEAVAVEIVSVLPRSPSTFQVQWRETTYLHGAPAPPERWTGLFTVGPRAPTNEAQLLANPKGLEITSFQWSRDL